MLEYSLKIKATHLINEHTPVHAGDLAAPHIRHLEVSVQQHLARERQLLARVVHADVEM